MSIDTAYTVAEFDAARFPRFSHQREKQDTESTQKEPRPMDSVSPRDIVSHVSYNQTTPEE